MRRKDTLLKECARTWDQGVGDKPISDDGNVPLINSRREYNFNAVSWKGLQALDSTCRVELDAPQRRLA
jgi:hypothetical protein